MTGGAIAMVCGCDAVGIYYNPGTSGRGIACPVCYQKYTTYQLASDGHRHSPAARRDNI